MGRGNIMKIERLELFPMRYPVKRYFKFFTGPHGGDDSPLGSH